MNIYNVHTCSICNFRHGRSFSVDGIIIRNDKVLLIQRGNEPYIGYWALPGGYAEYDETVEESICREAFEETGLTVTIDYLLGVYSKPSRSPNQAIAAAFVLKEISGNVKSGDDAKDCKWFPLNDLPQLAFDHREIIEDYKKRII